MALYYEVGGCFRCWDLQRQLDELEQELQQSRTQVARLTVENHRLESALTIRPPFPPVVHDPRPRRR
jgi:hypothetical protein